MHSVKYDHMGNIALTCNKFIFHYIEFQVSIQSGDFHQSMV